MKNHYGYSSYRGRSTVRRVLTVIAILLFLVLALSLALLHFLEPYWVYSADGARLVLPWSAPSAPSTPQTTAAPPTASEPLVIVTPEPVLTPPIHALLLPREALSDGTAAEQLSAAGANAALFDMKGDDGTLAYVSSLELAATAHVTATDPDLNAAIESLNAADGLYTVARVSCFRDNTLPQYENTLAIRSRGGNWRDGGDYRWLSPSVPEARQYVLDICLELAALGFDEILLDHAAYPTDGDLDYIRKNEDYDAARLEPTVLEFYTQLAGALEESYPDVRLSVVASPDVFSLASDSSSGQSLEMVSLMDRIWVRDLAGDRDACGELLSRYGLTDPVGGLVSLGAAPGEAEESWGVWP